MYSSLNLLLLYNRAAMLLKRTDKGKKAPKVGLYHLLKKYLRIDLEGDSKAQRNQQKVCYVDFTSTEMPNLKYYSSHLDVIGQEITCSHAW